MSELKLFHNQHLLGVISNITLADDDNMCGDIKFTPEFDRNKEMFSYLLVNGGFTPKIENPPCDTRFFYYWFVEFELGIRKEIDIPEINGNKIVWHAASF